VKEQNIYIRGYSYSRQSFIREDNPFIWRDLEWFKEKQYEEILALREDGEPKENSNEEEKQPLLPKEIILKFIRSDHPDDLTEEEREKMLTRKITIGSCKLIDPKLEK